MIHFRPLITKRGARPTSTLLRWSWVVIMLERFKQACTDFSLSRYNIRVFLKGSCLILKWNQIWRKFVWMKNRAGGYIQIWHCCESPFPELVLSFSDDPCIPPVVQSPDSRKMPRQSCPQEKDESKWPRKLYEKEAGKGRECKFDPKLARRACKTLPAASSTPRH